MATAISIQRRRVFVAGKIRKVKTNHGTKPCALGNHLGPFVRDPKYAEFMRANPDSYIDWTNYGECGACGSTITPEEIQRAA